MYSTIKTYFDARIVELNTALTATGATNITEVSINLNRTKLPLPQMQYNYMVKLLSYQRKGSQNKSYSVSGIVELSFMTQNKDITKYSTILTSYVHGLINKITTKENYASGGKHFGVLVVGASDLNNFSDTGSHLNCNITFEGEYLE